jgi:protein-tyrosine phosphatase
MIDIHTHILPGVDDGAQTMEDAVAMAKMAVADGVGAMVATPHSMEWCPEHGQDMLVERLAALQENLDAHGIALQVHPGLEVHISPDTLTHLQHGRVFTINRTRYLLLELPLSAYPGYTDRIVFDLQIAGFIPIIAHPERNLVLQQEPERLHTLVERGVLAQVTAASITGVFGKQPREAARLMLRHRLVHVIASDAHSTGRRSPVLSGAVREAATLIGDEAANAMVEATPASILAGAGIPMVEAVYPKSRGARFKFW